MRIKLAFVTVARSDFGRMEALLKALHQSDRFQLFLAAGAGHHDSLLGHTLDDVEQSGLPIDYVLPPVEGGAGIQAATILASMVRWLATLRPNALLILGDRYEMLAAAQAALLTQVPIIHIGGGHLTLGAMDERVRHALTKLSSLHLVASVACGNRVAALNESFDKIYVTGAPELDYIINSPVITREDFFSNVGLDIFRPFVLATFHPETNLSDTENAYLATQAKYALLRLKQQIVITAPCADPSSNHFLEMCQELSCRRPDIFYIPNLGLSKYIAALNYAEVMVGNSSSGIIEAASVGLPVVNVGQRQAMRDRPGNVLDCSFNADEIISSVLTASEPAFKHHSRYVINPYGDGKFVKKTLDILENLSWPLTIQKPWISNK